MADPSEESRSVIDAATNPVIPVGLDPRRVPDHADAPVAKAPRLRTPPELTRAWLLSRLATIGLLVGIAWLAGRPEAPHELASGNWFVDRFAFRDSYHLIRIADSGYFDPDRHCCDQAWFPGYPLLMRVLGIVAGTSSAAAGLAVSWVAVALIGPLLYRLVRAQGRADVEARWAVLLLGVAPWGIFLVCVYTEALWIALALLAWGAALRRQWWIGWVAAAAACSIRINGVFLVLALLVMFVQQRHSEGRLRRPGWEVLGLPLTALPVLGYATWLHGKTGSWTAWHDAEVEGWSRVPTSPWTTLTGQLQGIWSGPGSLTLTRLLDLVALAGAVAMVLLAMRWRAWPELVFLVLSVSVVVTAPHYDSVGRYSLSWLPIYWLGARVVSTWPERGRALLIGSSLALSLALITLCATRFWIG